MTKNHFYFKLNQIALSIFRFLASVKLAVLILVALIGISIWGTIVESWYDTYTAQETVYRTPLMFVILALLTMNLLFSMIKKFPWQRRHLSFLMAHIGILILILGSYITQRWGIDGSMGLSVGQKRNWISTRDTFIHVYQSKDGSIFLPQRLLSRPVAFLRHPSQQIKWQVQDHILWIDGFEPYALSETQIQASQQPFARPALRFTLQNKFATVSQWLMLEEGPLASKDFGPLQITLTSQEWPLEAKGNEIWFSSDLSLEQQPLEEQLSYALFSKKKRLKTGVIQAGEVLETPWMDQGEQDSNVKVRILKYLQKAEKITKYTPQERPNDLTTSAVHVRFGGQSAWIGLNSYKKFHVKPKTYIVSYVENQLGIGFDLQLAQFKVTHYPGSLKAASYESEILVDGKKHLISMNSPFKKNGFTFYQAGFQRDEDGNPVYSILSINRDPGRLVKYLGSILLVLGIILLFKKRRAKLKKQQIQKAKP